MDIKQFIYSHCVSPVKVKLWDSFSQSYRYMQMPCGKCLHCRNTYINEWVTRLYAQFYDSQYCYFITLDYAPFSYVENTFSDSTAELLAHETAAVWSNINKYHKYGMQPLLLVKHHLQNFLKRFRKNTGIAIQYFAAGEYGTHANGKGYGRPHFHLIVFSDTPVTHDMFQSAWTLNGYKIGNVDYVDMKHVQNLSQTKPVFKYVCKYLNKTDFEFEKLATIDFHRSYFKSLQFHFTEDCDLFTPLVPILDAKTLDENWSKYVKQYSPFSLCSRRPSIGSCYFEKNIERFQSRDFRLFGLPKECVAFPNYYIRRTKESLCRLVAVGQKSQTPSSSSRLGNISSILREVYRSMLDFENFGKPSEDVWHIRDKKYLVPYYDKSVNNHIPLNSLHLYDTENKIFYQCNGFYYTAWSKVKKLGYVRRGELDLLSIIDMIDRNFTPFYLDFITPLHYSKVLHEKELEDTINVLYTGESYDDKYAAFMADVYAYYQKEISENYSKKLITQNSKTTL